MKSGATDAAANDARRVFPEQRNLDADCPHDLIDQTQIQKEGRVDFLASGQKEYADREKDECETDHVTELDGTGNISVLMLVGRESPHGVGEYVSSCVHQSDESETEGRLPEHCRRQPVGIASRIRGRGRGGSLDQRFLTHGSLQLAYGTN
jgi:hypothetical protein